MNKICEICDAKNDIYATVCKNCGCDFYEDIKQTDKKTKKRSLIIFLVLGLIVPLIVVSSYFICLYAYLYGIESYSSEVFLNQYIALIKANDYKEIMSYNHISSDSFNTEKEFVMYLNTEYGLSRDKTVIIKDNKKSDDDTHIYKVQFDGKIIKEFTVQKTDKKKLFYFNTWEVKEPENNIYKESIKIYTPEGINIYVNGVLVGDEYLTGEQEILHHYDGIKDKNYRHPRLICYEMNNLMAISSVEAKRSDGGLCNIVIEDNIYNVIGNIPADKLSVLKPLAEKFAKKYAAFIAEDCKFKDISLYIHKDTLYYDTLREFYNGWFPVHNGHGYENIEYDNMLMYDENHASIQIKFNYYITYGGNKKRDYPVAYEIYFANINGAWLVTNVKNY